MMLRFRSLAYALLIGAFSLFGTAFLLNPHTSPISNRTIFPIAAALLGTLSIVIPFFSRRFVPRFFGPLLGIASLLPVIFLAFTPYRSVTIWFLVPFYLGFVAVALSLGFLWSSSLRKSALPYVGGIESIGWAVLSYPFVMICLSGLLTYHETWARERAIDTLIPQSAIRNYSEEFITWAGFPDPVGLQIEFDLRIPLKHKDSMSGPRVWMGELPKGNFRQGGALSFWFTPYTFEGFFPSSIDLAQFESKKRLRILSSYKNVFDQQTFTVLENDWDVKPAHFRYSLFPGTLFFLRKDSVICLRTIYPGLVAEPAGLLDNLGTNLSVSWQGLRGTDLSKLLTAALREGSSLQDKPEMWQRIQRSLEPETLARAGYLKCRRMDTPVGVPEIGEQCYCTKEAKQVYFSAAKGGVDIDAYIRQQVPPGLNPLRMLKREEVPRR